MKAFSAFMRYKKCIRLFNYSSVLCKVLYSIFQQRNMILKSIIIVVYELM